MALKRFKCLRRDLINARWQRSKSTPQTIGNDSSGNTTNSLVRHLPNGLDAKELDEHNLSWAVELMIPVLLLLHPHL